MFLTIAVAVVLSGCGMHTELPDFHTDLVPVSGTIRFKKQPLGGAAIMFVPSGSEAVRAAYGLTDDQGKYTVTTPIRGLSVNKTQGAVPGAYRVIISRLKMPDGSAVPVGLTEADAQQQGAKELLPPKYSKDEMTVLSAKIEKNTPRTDLDFDL